MAESEEEVDVEDISDGEQISNLRDLAEDDHKDKWYDNVSGFISNLKLCLGDIRLDIYIYAILSTSPIEILEI